MCRGAASARKAPAMHLIQARLLVLSCLPCVLCIALAFPTSPVVPRETSSTTPWAHHLDVMSIRVSAPSVHIFI